MNTQKLQLNNYLVFAMILVFAVFRCFFPGMDNAVANYTPLGALAIFGGAKFSNNFKAIFIPVAIFMLSDLFINYYYYGGKINGFFHDTWFAVYLSFVLIALVSKYIMKKTTVASTLLATITATLIHWIVTDTAVWAVGYYGVAPTYSKDLAGLITCHVAAIPFEINFFIGTVLYSSILFGVFELIKVKKPELLYVNK